jgi:CoA:oxalate CoA-transferase
VRDDSSPLAGLVILDLTRVLAGPYCTRLLADLGARVIKIERPGSGDEMRRAYLQLEDGRDDQSTYFVRCNVGKESVALDLGHPEAPGVMRDLARLSDVVVENFVPGVMARLHCDYETLAAVKPDLIYCSISGYGQSGPWRHRPAFAHLINAASGMMALEQGPDPAPRPAYIQAADVLAGTHAFGAILAALWRRARTGPSEPGSWSTATAPCDAGFRRPRAASSSTPRPCATGVGRSWPSRPTSSARSPVSG